MKDKMIIGIVVVLIAVVIGFFIFQEDEEESIKIGAIAPFTGAAATIALDFQKGVLLATEDVNNKGGINGRPLEIVFAGNNFTPEDQAKAFQKLESEHKPLLYIGFPGHTLVETVKETKVVLFINPGITLTDPGDWAYSYSLLDKAVLPPLRFIFEELNLKKLGVLYLDVEWGRSTTGFIEEEFRKKGVEVTSIVIPPTTPHDYDFSKEIEQLRDSDAFYLLLSPDHQSLLTRLQQADYEGIIIGSVIMAHPKVFKDPAAEGMYFTTSPIYNPNFIFAQEVSEKYKATYDEELSYVPAFGYDFIFLISEIMEGEELTRDGVRKTLAKGFTCSCVVGNVEAYEGEHNIPTLLFPAKVVNGTLEYLQ